MSGVWVSSLILLVEVAVGVLFFLLGGCIAFESESNISLRLFSSHLGAYSLIVELVTAKLNNMPCFKSSFVEIVNYC